MTVALPAKPVPLKFEIGARTLIAISRSLVRVPLSLDDAREGRLPQLPPLERDAQLKRSLGFSEATFTRAAQVLRGVV